MHPHDDYIAISDSQEKLLGSGFRVAEERLANPFPGLLRSREIGVHRAYFGHGVDRILPLGYAHPD
jgi:hypothetical protein